MIVNWNANLWRLVWGNDRGLPSALLLAGPAGVGKGGFAQSLAQAALCSDRAASNKACGVCHACRLFLAGTHPDVRVLEALPSDDAGSTAETGTSSATRIIGVDRIRDLQDFTGVSSHLGGRKVVVIDPADRLHPSAANALLKTLEEPSPGTLFVLVSARPQQLPATVRSRCFRLNFRPPSRDDALSWLRSQGVEDAEVALAHAGMAPLTAADLVHSPFWQRRRDIARLLGSEDATASELSRAIAPEETANFCGLLYKWCADVLSLRLAGRVRYNPDYAKSLSRLAVNSDVLKLQRFMRELTGVLRYLEHPLNQRLVCEKVALGYIHALAAKEN